MRIIQAAFAVFSITVALIMGFPVAGAEPSDPIEVISRVGGMLENVTALTYGDYAGGYAVSDLRQGLFYVRPDGTQGAPFSRLPDLGGVVQRGNQLIFAVGNTGEDALLGRHNGSIRMINLDTFDPLLAEQGVDQSEVLVDTITAPNGLAVLPGGTIIFSTALGDMGIYKVIESATEVNYAVKLNRGVMLTPNGVSAGPDGMIYVASTGGMEMYVLDPATGHWWPLPTTVPSLLPRGIALFCDDLVAVDSGSAYCASETGVIWGGNSTVRMIAPELVGASSIKRDTDGSFVVTTFNGVLLRLRL